MTSNSGCSLVSYECVSIVSASSPPDRFVTSDTKIEAGLLPEAPLRMCERCARVYGTLYNLNCTVWWRWFYIIQHVLSVLTPLAISYLGLSGNLFIS